MNIISVCKLGTSLSTISGSFIFIPEANISCKEVIFPDITSLPSCVRGVHSKTFSSRLSLLSLGKFPLPNCFLGLMKLPPTLLQKRRNLWFLSFYPHFLCKKYYLASSHASSSSC